MEDQGIQVQDETGARVAVVDGGHGALTMALESAPAPDANAYDVFNPLQEREILCRTRPGVEFWHQGQVLRKSGEADFRMAISIARLASAFVDEVLPDGTLRPVQFDAPAVSPALQVARAAMAGKTRQERAEALDKEESALRERLARVEAMKAETAGPVPGAPNTTSNPPRPGEQGGPGSVTLPAATPDQPNAPSVPGEKNVGKRVASQ